LGGTPSLGRPRERRPLLGGVYVLVPIWLGAPRPAWPPKSLMKRGLPGFLGRYLVTVLVHDTRPHTFRPGGGRPRTPSTRTATIWGAGSARRRPVRDRGARTPTSSGELVLPPCNHPPRRRARRAPRSPHTNPSWTLDPGSIATIGAQEPQAAPPPRRSPACSPAPPHSTFARAPPPRARARRRTRASPAPGVGCAPATASPSPQ